MFNITCPNLIPILHLKLHTDEGILGIAKKNTHDNVN